MYFQRGIMKKCSMCRKAKVLAEFSQAHTRAGGYHGYCKSCNKERNRRWRQANPERSSRTSFKSALKFNYGLTLEQYTELLQSQAGVCAICRTPNRDGKRLAVDHNHETGKIRGLLCQGCNFAIGHLKEDPQLFDAAKEYVCMHAR